MRVRSSSWVERCRNRPPRSKPKRLSWLRWSIRKSRSRASFPSPIVKWKNVPGSKLKSRLCKRKSKYCRRRWTRWLNSWAKLRERKGKPKYSRFRLRHSRSSRRDWQASCKRKIMKSRNTDEPSLKKTSKSPKYSESSTKAAISLSSLRA